MPTVGLFHWPFVDGPAVVPRCDHRGPPRLDRRGVNTPFLLVSRMEGAGPLASRRRRLVRWFDGHRVQRDTPGGPFGGDDATGWSGSPGRHHGDHTRDRPARRGRARLVAAEPSAGSRPGNHGPPLLGDLDAGVAGGPLPRLHPRPGGRLDPRESGCRRGARRPRELGGTPGSVTGHRCLGRCRGGRGPQRAGRHAGLPARGRGHGPPAADRRGAWQAG